MNWKKNRSGMSLTEIMIALSLFVLVMSMASKFMIEILTNANSSTFRLDQSEYIQKFSDQVLLHARRANEFVLYKSNASADRDDATAPYVDRLAVDTSTDPDTHPAGDFLVFVYYEIPKPAGQALHRKKLLEGYFLEGTAGQIGKLRKVTIDLSAAPTADPVEKILTDHWGSDAVFTDFLLNVRSLALPDGGTVPRFFYLRDSRSIIIAGQIYHASKNNITSDRRTYTDSFSFTISPRS
jgi:prepilin-type N-terminal cleavage/methylation domain-containing protein